eukprot:jgi/Mesen1/1920/ME000144S01046
MGKQPGPLAVAAIAGAIGAAGILGMKLLKGRFTFEQLEACCVGTYGRDAPGIRIRFDLSPLQIHQEVEDIIAASERVHDQIAAVPLHQVTYERVIQPLALLEAEEFAHSQACELPAMVSPSKALRDASNDAQIALDAYHVKCSMREDVYRVVKAYAQLKEPLPPEQQRYVDRLVRDSERLGLSLDAATRAHVERLKTRAGELCITFQKHLNEDNTLLYFTRQQLLGMPPDFISSLKPKEAEKEGAGEGEGPVALSDVSSRLVEPFLPLLRGAAMAIGALQEPVSQRIPSHICLRLRLCLNLVATVRSHASGVPGRRPRQRSVSRLGRVRVIKQEGLHLTVCAGKRRVGLPSACRKGVPKRWGLLSILGGAEGCPEQVVVAALLANFTKPGGGKNDKQPSLLQHSEVETFFHEFGHVVRDSSHTPTPYYMHHICSRVEVARFSGTRMERDFVEAPSQMLEHWCWQMASLKLMSAHYQSGEAIPDDMCEKLLSSKKAHAGLLCKRQLLFGTPRLFDQAIHTQPQADTGALLQELHPKIMMGIEMTKGTNLGASFGHLAGGYDASYYGYMWSEVLEPGGSKDAADILQDFLGRSPSEDAFLISKGLEM